MRRNNEGPTDQRCYRAYSRHIDLSGIPGEGPLPPPRQAGDRPRVPRQLDDAPAGGGAGERRGGVRPVHGHSYELWRNHPDIGETWEPGCRRVSLTTVLATEHVARVNAARRGVKHRGIPILADRWLDERTCYLNLRLDPSQWAATGRAGTGRTWPG